MTVGPPTCPEVISFNCEIKDPPLDSVYPYSSIMGQESAIFKKVIILSAIGAEVVTINLTLPFRSHLMKIEFYAENLAHFLEYNAIVERMRVETKSFEIENLRINCLLCQ